MAKRKQGELEAQVLSCLWDRPDGLSSQQILALLGDDSLAITTVLTVLTRLSGKNLVEKTSGTGRTLLFRSVTSREEHAAEVLLSAMNNSNPALVFKKFAAGLTSDQQALLRRELG